ncbi:MAG: alpha/beta hydrolase [Cellulosilyticum sp.]|nr:alpha/beta hydrolase [Cellulosilyticum sp.]
MLFTHGTADQLVPFEMLDRVYEAPRGEKEKQVFEGAGHVMAYRKEPERYWNGVYDFIEKHLED